MENDRRLYSGYASIVAAVMVVAGAIGGLLASNSAKPGDALYKLDLAAEDVRVAFQTSPLERAELESELAAERIKEANQLVVASASASRVREALTRAQQHTVSAKVAANMAQNQGDDTKDVLAALEENQDKLDEVVDQVTEETDKAPDITTGEESVQEVVESGAKGFDELLTAIPLKGETGTSTSPQSPGKSNEPAGPTRTMKPLLPAGSPRATKSGGSSECQNVQESVSQRNKALVGSATATRDKFGAIALASQEYYSSKVVPAGGVVNDYAKLAANVGAKSLAATTAIETAAKSTILNCGSANPKGEAQEFDAAMRGAKGALSDYRDAINTLIKAILPVSDTTNPGSRPTGSTSPIRQDGKGEQVPPPNFLDQQGKNN